MSRQTVETTCYRSIYRVHKRGCAVVECTTCNQYQARVYDAQTGRQLVRHFGSIREAYVWRNRTIRVLKADTSDRPPRSSVYARGARWIATWKDVSGKQHWESFPTRSEAEEVHAAAIGQKIRTLAELRSKSKAASARMTATAAEGYGAVRRAAQAIDGATRDAPNRTARAHLNAALDALYRAEDEIVRAIGEGA